MTRYTVCNLADSSEVIHNLTSSEAIKYIYRDEGGDYKLEPKMDCYGCDDEGYDLPDSQETDSDGNLIFELWFKRSCNHKYLKSPLTTAGATEADAENKFLDSAFEFIRYDATKWIIMQDDDYIAQKKTLASEYNLIDYNY